MLPSHPIPHPDTAGTAGATEPRASSAPPGPVAGRLRQAVPGGPGEAQPNPTKHCPGKHSSRDNNGIMVGTVPLPACHPQSRLVLPVPLTLPCWHRGSPAACTPSQARKGGYPQPCGTCCSQVPTVTVLWMWGDVAGAALCQLSPPVPQWLELWGGDSGGLWGHSARASGCSAVCPTWLMPTIAEAASSPLSIPSHPCVHPWP